MTDTSGTTKKGISRRGVLAAAAGVAVGSGAVTRVPDDLGAEHQRHRAEACRAAGDGDPG